MVGFVSHSVHRIDRKGRVSIPAAFRAVLADDGHPGIYCYPSLDMPAVDAGGHRLLAEIEKRLGRFEPFSLDHDILSTAFYGESDVIWADPEGRVSLPDRLIAHMGVTDEVVFVGLGYKFQLWAPAAFAAQKEAARQRASALRQGTLGNGTMTGGAA